MSRSGNFKYNPSVFTLSKLTYFNVFHSASFTGVCFLSYNKHFHSKALLKSCRKFTIGEIDFSVWTDGAVIIFLVNVSSTFRLFVESSTAFSVKFESLELLLLFMVIVDDSQQIYEAKNFFLDATV